MRYGVAWLLAFTLLVTLACGPDAADTAPTQAPAASPTPQPTAAPPTQSPTAAPTSQPTAVPPTQPPTALPTRQPTAAPPTQPPTAAPTRQPTAVPPTQPPTAVPTPEPTAAPPTPAPTAAPTNTPTVAPTSTPVPAPEPAPTPTLPALPGIEGPTIITDIANRKLSDVTIPAGTVLLWSQLDAVSHTTTSGTPGNTTGLWDSGELDRGDSFSYTFTEEGAFPYFCKIHPDTMRATVEVLPAG